MCECNLKKIHLLLIIIKALSISEVSRNDEGWSLWPTGFLSFCRTTRIKRAERIARDLVRPSAASFQPVQSLSRDFAQTPY